ncbi:MAG: DUF2530 domain-containing protein [Rhodoluna sp.]|nr:DUF2530 domain-containing protein [Rhodoluna sp.]MBP7818657.1 DUF2530 domain-containing protein [Rhodoluna sp.]
MKFYIKDSERKPDPQPVKTNAKLAISVGLVLWSLALVVLLFAGSAIPAAQESWTLTCLAGIGLGLYALFHVRKR